MIKTTALAFSLLFAISAMAQKTAPGFKFITPTAGMKSLPMWIKGDTVQIKWKGGNPSDHIGLTLIIKDPFMVHSVIAPDLDNTGNYDWIIPNTIRDGIYQVYIHDLDNPSLFWYSGDFALETRSFAQQKKGKKIEIKKKG